METQPEDLQLYKTNRVAHAQAHSQPHSHSHSHSNSPSSLRHTSPLPSHPKHPSHPKSPHHPAPPDAKTLSVTLFSCEDLSPTYKLGFGVYCRLSLHAPNQTLLAEHRTKLLKNTLSPRWNSTFQFTVHCGEDDPLLLSVHLIEADEDGRVENVHGYLRWEFRPAQLTGELLTENLSTNKFEPSQTSLQFSVKEISRVPVQADDIVSRLLEIMSLAQHPEEGVQLCEHKFLLNRDIYCFMGKDFVNFLMKKSFVSSREEGVVLSQKLVEDGLIDPLIKGTLFRDTHSLFRFKTKVEDVKLNDQIHTRSGTAGWLYKKSSKGDTYKKRWCVVDLTKHLLILAHQEFDGTSLELHREHSHSIDTQEADNMTIINLQTVSFVTLVTCRTKKANFKGLKLETPFREWTMYAKDAFLRESIYSLLYMSTREKRPAGTIQIEVIRARSLTFNEPSVVTTSIHSHCTVELADWHGNGTGTKYQTEDSVLWKRLFELDFNEDHRGLLVSLYLQNTKNPHGTTVVDIDGVNPNQTIKHWFPIYWKGKVTGAVQLAICLQIHKGASLGSTMEQESNEIKNKRSPRKKQLHQRNQTLVRQDILEHNLKFQSCAMKLSYIYSLPTVVWDGALTIEVKQVQNVESDIGRSESIFANLRYSHTNYKSPSTTLTNPNWNFSCTFVVPKILTRSDCITISLETEGKGLIAEMYLLFRKMVPNKVITDWFPLTRIRKPKMLHGTRLGQLFSQMTYKPKKPIILIPGFGGSAMKVLASPIKSWEGQRIWCSVSKISSEWGKRAIIQNINDNTNNTWIEHMMLESDGVSDPAGIKVRPIEGMHGIDFLAPSKLTANATAVFGPLIHNLECVGYNKSNLIPFPYDWRIPPSYLETRDKKLSKLKRKIEKAVSLTGQKMIVVAHSMGNKIFRYFLSWLGTDSKGWAEKHIDCWYAVGSPWLGSSKALRSLISGYRFGLNSFLTKDEAVMLSRASGSVSLLLPFLLSPYYGNNSHVYLNEQDEEIAPVQLTDYLKKTLPNVYDIYEKWYKNDPHYHNILTPPEGINRLHSVYGVNIDTEIAGFYTEDLTKKRTHCLTKDLKNLASFITMHFPGTSSKKGLVLETRESEQHILKETQGISAYRAGDGTVPYASLHYPIYWKNRIPELLFTELDGSSHPDTPCVEEFLSLLIERACEKEMEESEGEEKTEQHDYPKEMGSKKYSQKKVYFAVNDIIKSSSQEQIKRVLCDIVRDKLDEVDLMNMITYLVSEKPELLDLIKQKTGHTESIPVNKQNEASEVDHDVAMTKPNLHNIGKIHSAVNITRGLETESPKRQPFLEHDKKHLSLPSVVSGKREKRKSHNPSLYKSHIPALSTPTPNLPLPSTDSKKHLQNRPLPQPKPSKTNK